ncbi:er lumen protein-retaining receptor [Quercus suber]|uniref:Er lumen protein-retaining receptor n=1 Tax=Quercus suber TaxID=58331 RepID=A0AAW0M481_QUESU
MNVLSEWVKKQSMRMKICLGAMIALLGLVALKHTIHDLNHFYIGSEFTHALGIIVLIYKLTTKKTCSGLSLKTQELTALFVAARLVTIMAGGIYIILDVTTLVATLWVIYIIRFKLKSTYIKELDNFPLYYVTQELTALFVAARLVTKLLTIMAGGIYIILDVTTLVAKLWVIYMIRFKLKSTYIKELDDFPLYYVVVPCAILATPIHPYTYHFLICRILWAFGSYLETISVLPQLRLMQNAKMIEPFTAHYVFALGISRFLACAHWIVHSSITATEAPAAHNGKTTKRTLFSATHKAF